MTISRLFATAALCAVCSGMVAGQNSQGQRDVEKRITATLREMYEAEKRKDLKFVLSNLADDFTEVAGNGGLYHRADIEAGWSDVALKHYEVSECVFKLMAADAAYMSCKMEVDATYQGQPLPKRFRVTTVWSRHNDAWLIRFEQGTPIPEAKPPTSDKTGRDPRIE